MPSAPVQTVPEMMVDPQTKALGMLQNLDDGINLMAMPSALMVIAHRCETTHHRSVNIMR